MNSFRLIRHLNRSFWLFCAFSAGFFPFQAGGAVYYVNDASTNGDVYCSDVGISTNTGLTPASPKLQVQEILDTYVLGTNDIVFIDAGLYTNSFTVTSADQGSPAGYVSFVGNTNRYGGKTFFRASTGTAVPIRFNTVQYVCLKGAVIQGGGRGVDVLASSHSILENVHAASNSYGFYISGNAQNTRFDRCLAANNTYGMHIRENSVGTTWDHGVMYSNVYAYECLDTVIISNSVIVGGTAFTGSGYPRSGVPLTSSSVIFWQTQIGGGYTYLSDVHAATTNWYKSTFAEPQFANPLTGDFHPKSVEGRWNGMGWATDIVHSALIDLGDLKASYSNEPVPNGEVVNVGLYGDTVEASKSQTNLWLMALTYNDGGTLFGTGELHWAGGNFTNGATVRVDYSTNGGSSFTIVASGLPFTNRMYRWDASSSPSSLRARWRVVAESDLSVTDVNDVDFYMRADLQGFRLYVNDNSTVGDVYCSAVGSSTNDGLASGRPKDSLVDLLATYKLGPGDFIYVDTGLYTNATVTITRDDDGAEAGPITIMGSTNFQAGGSVLDRRNVGLDVLRLNGVSHYRIHNLVLKSGRYGVLLETTSGIVPVRNVLENVSAESNTVGFAYNIARSNLFVRCQAVRNGTAVRLLGGTALQNSGNLWSHGVCWSNGSAFNILAGSISISNSVIVGGTNFVNEVAHGDYNVVWNVQIKPGAYNTLSELQKGQDTWWRSLVANPEFYDPGGGDFHPRSIMGRYDPISRLYVSNDLTTSVLVDFGDPFSTAYTNEQAPNGSRVNAGLWGGTSQASKSRTNAWLQVLSLNDGGILDAAGDKLYWNAGAYLPGDKVKIEFSRNSGESWVTIATNLDVALGLYNWSNTNYPSSSYSQWRIVLESNTNVLSTTSANFLYRNGPFVYYVNNNTTNGDIYTSKPGDDSYLGVSPDTPKASLRNLINSVALQPGDIVYVDTGYYHSDANILITALDCGTNGNPVIIQGSTNYAAGGTILDRINSQPINYMFEISSVLGSPSDLIIRDFHVVRGGYGVHMTGATRIQVESVFTRLQPLAGFYMTACTNIALSRCVGRQNGLGVQSLNSHQVNVGHSVFWGATNIGMRVQSGWLMISNSVLMADNSAAYLFYASTTTNILGDYNVLHTRGDAVVGYVQSLGRNLDTLSAWQGFTTQEVYSLARDPLFADPDNDDYHPMTATPRGRRKFDGGFTSDLETSPLIDAGSPSSVYTNEPFPNGSRVNIGLYGNTWQASIGMTNPWVRCASLTDGGWVRGVYPLHWLAGGGAATQQLRIEFSPNGGNSWNLLTNGISAGVELYAWNTAGLTNTLAGLWRITSLVDSNVSDCTTNFFGVRNTNLTIYLNDASLDGDVYTTAVGSPSNWMATSAQPLDSLQTVFQRFDLEPGDIVWVDNGIYTNPANVILSRRDAGMTNARVQIIGNGRRPYSGTVMDRNSLDFRSAGLLLAQGGDWVTVSNILFRGGNHGVVVSNSAGILLSVRTSGNATNGIASYNATNLNLIRCVSDNNYNGVYLQETRGATIAHSLICSNQRSAVHVVNGWADAYHNILISAGLDSRIYHLTQPSDALFSRYNNLRALDQAPVAFKAGRTLKFLMDWQLETSNDLYSLSFDPLFADPGQSDYHLLSASGRYNPFTDSVVTDTVTSLLIDNGNPSADFSLEPMPNGSRVNIGLFGNTPQASGSRTNGWLLALTLNDGGAIRGTNTLYWSAGGPATSQFVYVDYSYDGGATWTNIATNLQGSTGFVVWDTTNYPSTAVGVWRVVSQADTNIYGRTRDLFAVKNEPLGFFVNDAVTNGDVYTTAPGNPLYSGLRPSEPKSSIQDILDAYNVEAGDVLYVDTGLYSMTNPVTLRLSTESGTNVIALQGSTNYAMGGSLLNFNGKMGFDLRSCFQVHLRDFIISNANVGVYLRESTNCRMTRISMRQPGIGIWTERSLSNMAMRCAVAGFLTNGVYLSDGSQDFAWESGVMESAAWFDTNSLGPLTTGRCIIAEGAFVTVSNSSFTAMGPQDLIYLTRNNGRIVGNFNNHSLSNGARMAMNVLGFSVGADEEYLDSVAMWVREMGQDLQSLSHNPRFAKAGAGDFHLQSQQGRVDPTSGLFVADAETSDLIDAGDPLAPFGMESLPNGNRRNIGVHGDTLEASRTPTNSFFTILSLNDGGFARGTNQILRWVAHGNATGHTVRIEFSPNAGSNWSTIATTIPASWGWHAWNTTGATATVYGVWRIISELEPSAKAQSEKPFAVRNTPLYFYVNDASTTGDVYSSAVGSATNTGLSPDSPRPSLQSILASYDLEGGDVVYVDTGLYTGLSTCVIGQLDSGSFSNRLQIVGSTNYLFGGTVFRGFGLRMDQTRGVSIAHLTIQNASPAGVYALKTSDSDFDRVVIHNSPDGFYLDRCLSNRMVHCAVAGSISNAINQAGSDAIEWSNGVLWSNTVGLRLSNAGKISVYNTVIEAFGVGSYVYVVAGGTLQADYNNLVVRQGALVASESDIPLNKLYDSVSRWARDTGRDAHSLTEEPQFANPLSRDFHLRSLAGRWNPALGYTNDATTSALLDAGNPSAVYTNEPLPNGARLNIGMYGDTHEASLSPTNSRLTMISLNDGGRAEGTNVILYWVAQGNATNHLLTLRFSADAGVSWIPVATNVLASQGFFVWDSTAYPDSIRALWALDSQTEIGLQATSSVPFALRNAPLAFYVNDNATQGDVYTWAVGSSTNTGLDPFHPKASLEEILSAYDLESGDTVYVDTGEYVGSSPIQITLLDSAGGLGLPKVVFQGSTNMAYGGTVITRLGATSGFNLSRVMGVELRNFVIRGASQYGVRLEYAFQCHLEWLHVTGAGQGYNLEASDEVTLRHCGQQNASVAGLYLDSASRIRWEQGVLWSNGSYGVYVQGSSLSVSNSIVGMYGPERYAYYIQSGSLQSDYNCFFLTNQARAVFRRPVLPTDRSLIYPNVALWTRAFTQDVHSLAADPLFADSARGDFHLRSQAGRYVATNKTFVMDPATSPLVDAGSPGVDYSLEQEPNGARLNMGLYGNSGEASKTPTNATLTALSLTDGGRVEGLKTLYWVARGAATGHLVRIEYSADGGASWLPIASDIPAFDGVSTWNTLSAPSSMLGLWRVVSQPNTNIYGQTRVFFAIRNQPLAFYVNDNSLSGDVYTSSIGNDENFGVSSNAPKLSINSVLEAWDVEPGDTLFIDTGTYLLSASVNLDFFDSGDSTNDSARHVRIQGSTNDVAGGSVFVVSGSMDAFVLDNAPGVSLRNLTIRGANNGVKMLRSEHSSCHFVRCEKGQSGFWVQNSPSTLFRSCVAAHNQLDGLSCDGNLNAVYWENGILWSNRYGVYKQSGFLSVYNSIIGSFQDGGVRKYAFYVVDRFAPLTSDYNNIYLQNGAYAAGVLESAKSGSYTSDYTSLARWYAGTGRDKYSLAFEPSFVDVGAGDYHLRSTKGRYKAGVGWTNDLQPSVLIDSGNPYFDYAAEPMPNGGRINIDLYGGTWQASMTPTQGWYSIITLNDGGSVQDCTELRWFAGWIATGHTVRIDFSADDGKTWTNITGGWPASTLSYVWCPQSYPRTALGRWRITSEVDPSINATNRFRFYNRVLGTIPYYVNDASTNGDVYCTRPGSPTNDGLTAATPKNSIQDILDEYDLDPVDVVYVDSGTYSLKTPVEIGLADSGLGTNRVIFQGSTNLLVPTVLQSEAGTGYGVKFNYARGIIFRDFIIQNCAIGVGLFRSEDCLLENIRCQGNRSGGFQLENSYSLVFDQCVTWNNRQGANGYGVDGVDSGFHWVNGIIWGQPLAISHAGPQAGKIGITNSVLHANGNAGRIFMLGANISPSLIQADYNNYWLDDAAIICEAVAEIGGNDYYVYLNEWQGVSGSDANSLRHAPLFNNESNGEFWPKSEVGRYRPGVGWTNDMEHSPLIDLGNPQWPYNREPDPNGDRINMGLYANMPYASMSRTNPWLLAITFNDGGIIRGTNLIRWASGGMTNGTTVRLEFTADGGVSWGVIESNVLHNAFERYWDASQESMSPLVLWRVVSESNTNISDQTDVMGAIKNGELTIYVNDTNTLGDVYTTEPGSSLNSGTNAASPLDNPATALRKYPLTAGDTVYIDTGNYFIPGTDGMYLNLLNRGSLTHPIRIIGSTNVVFGGSRIDRQETNSYAFMAAYTRNFELSHLRFNNYRWGVVIQSALNCRMENIECWGGSDQGFRLLDSANVTMSRCLSWSNSGVGMYSSVSELGPQYVDQSILWRNARGAVEHRSGVLSISNSILHSSMPGSSIYVLNSQNASLIGDFNVLWHEQVAGLATDLYLRVRYDNLKQWQDRTRSDVHSFIRDPLLVAPEQGDFHVQSQSGYFVPTSGTFRISSNTSWAIDAGGFSNAYLYEPPPNGNRMNVGLHGNSFQASKSLTNYPALLTVSLNDGGVMRSDQALYWLFRGMSHTNTVRLNYSPDSGANWILIAEGVSVTSPGYWWADTNPPSPSALWQVILEADTNISATTASTFMKRTGPITYYVNDLNAHGDIYTTALGNSTNYGYYSNSPLPSLLDVINNYEVGPGDRIYVDTGVYTVKTPIVVGFLDSGAETNPVEVVGSTNWLAGGSVLIGQGLEHPLFMFETVAGYEFRNLDLRNGIGGFLFDRESSRFNLQDLQISGGSNYGIKVQGSSGGLTMDRVLIRNSKGTGVEAASGSIKMDRCVIWSNRLDAVRLASSVSAEISNSVLYASGLTNACYHLQTNAMVYGNFNNLFLTNGAKVAIADGLEVDALPQWTKLSGQDMHSLGVDPLFHDSGNGDFHVKSATGRYDPLGGGYVSNDTVYSYLIDLGATNALYENEPLPNGGRRNIGLYGNTEQASLSRTNEWLFALTASSGGRVEGLFYLIWGWGNLSPTNRVLLDYSYDNGQTWASIDKAPLAAGRYLWMSDVKIGDEERWPTSPFARWRISLEANTNLYDITDSHFVLRNQLIRYYVNDTNTVNDIYCTAPGSETNLGFFAWAPKLTLRNLLEIADLEGEDIVLIDTGRYVISNESSIIIGRADEGKSRRPVLFRGNTSQPWTVFVTATNLTEPFFSIMANYLDFGNITFVNGMVGGEGNELAFRDVVVSNQSLVVFGESAEVERVRITKGHLQLASWRGQVRHVEILEGYASFMATNGLFNHSVVYVSNGPAVMLNGNDMSFSNNTIVSRSSALRVGGAGPHSLANNIILASGEDNSCIEWKDGALSSDYNNLVARDGAWIGNRDGKWEKLLYWQRASGKDGNSISAEPLFVDEAGFNFHLQSETGYWAPTGWVQSAQTSPGVDMGDPMVLSTNEPQPNGGRINLGAYGDTPQASKSRTNLWLMAITVNDGGVLKGTNILRWNSGNFSPAHTVRLQYSADNGTNWTTIVSGLEASLGQYSWDSTLYESSLYARWRVASDYDAGLHDACDTSFALRNEPLAFYVNDGVTDGDVYCTAAGSSAYDGLTPATPKDSLRAILDLYDVEPLDVIKVDTGIYVLSNNTRIIWSRGGEEGWGQMVIQGSTNYAAEGSVLSRTRNLQGDRGIDVKASRVTVRDLTLRGAYQGLLLESNQQCIVESVLVRSNVYGLVAEGANAFMFRNNKAWSNTLAGVDLLWTRTAVVENMTFVAHTNTGIRLTGTAVDTLQNNIFVMNGSSNATAYSAAAGLIGAAFIDYNVYHLVNQSFIWGTYSDLRIWQLDRAKDFRSAITNPLLANVEAGDFHLKSQAGRYVDGVGWTNDPVTSWAIDRGNPASDYSQEPMTNGARINIGAYGNTPFASKGSTNSILEIRSLDGPTFIGVTNSLWPLTWTAFRLPTNEMVKVQFSGDGGASWVDLTNSVSAYREYILWQTSPYFNTYKGQWRVVGINNTNYWDASDSQFQIFYGEFAISRIYREANLNNIIWRGAWDEHYLVEYSPDMSNWYPAVSGFGLNQTNDFVSKQGGDFIYADAASIVPSPRMYRVRRVLSDATVLFTYMYRVNNMETIVWTCAEPSTFTVEVSTNMATWAVGPTGPVDEQRATFTAPSGGSFTYQDRGSSNSPHRVYRILRE